MGEEREWVNRDRERGGEEKEREMMGLLLRIPLKETHMQRTDHKFGFDGSLRHGSLSSVHEVRSQTALHACYVFPHKIMESGAEKIRGRIMKIRVKTDII